MKSLFPRNYLYILMIISFIFVPTKLICPIINPHPAPDPAANFDPSVLTRPASSKPGSSIFTTNNIFIDPRTGYIVDGTGQKVTGKIDQPARKSDLTLEKTILKEIVKIPFGKEKDKTKAIFSAVLYITNTMNSINKVMKAAPKPDPTQPPYGTVQFWGDVLTDYSQSANPSVVESIKTIIKTGRGASYTREITTAIVNYGRTKALKGLMDQYGKMVLKGKTPDTINNYADIVNGLFDTIDGVLTGTATKKETRRFKFVRTTANFLNSSRKLFFNKKLSVQDMSDAVQGEYLNNQDFITTMVKNAISAKIKSMQNAVVDYAKNKYNNAKTVVIDGVTYSLEKASNGISYVLTELNSGKTYIVEQLQSLKESCLYSIKSASEALGYLVQTTQDGAQLVAQCALDQIDTVKTSVQATIQQGIDAAKAAGQTVVAATTTAIEETQNLASLAMHLTKAGTYLVTESVSSNIDLTIESIQTMTSFTQGIINSGSTMLSNAADIVMTAPSALLDGVSYASDAALRLCSLFTAVDVDLSNLGELIDSEGSTGAPSDELKQSLNTMMQSEQSTIDDMDNALDAIPDADDAVYYDALNYIENEMLPKVSIKQAAPEDVATLSTDGLRLLEAMNRETQIARNKIIAERAASSLPEKGTVLDPLKINNGTVAVDPTTGQIVPTGDTPPDIITFVDPANSVRSQDLDARNEEERAQEEEQAQQAEKDREAEAQKAEAEKEALIPKESIG